MKPLRFRNLMFTLHRYVGLACAVALHSEYYRNCAVAGLAQVGE
jgi:hypothetical protein